MATTTVGKVALTPKGEYDETATYERLDVVTYEGASYIVLQDDTVGVTPEEGDYYHLMSKGAYGYAVAGGYEGTEDDFAALMGDTASQSDLDVLSARMDTFAALEDGSTTGDAELADIRVGADGMTYTSAGAAVRGQIGNLSDELDIFSTKETTEYTETYANPDVENLLDGVELTANLTVNTSGVETSSTNYYITDYIPVAYNTYVAFYVSQETPAYDGIGMWAFYDEDKAFLKRNDLSSLNKGTVDTTRQSWSNGAYMRFMIGINADFDTIHIAVGADSDEALENYNNYWLTRDVTKTIDRSVFRLLDNSVTTDKIADSNVTLEKLAADVLEYVKNAAEGSAAESYAESKDVYINPAIPAGWCCSQLEESDYSLSSSPSTLSIGTYLQLFNALASTYSEYITYTAIGTDASGLFVIPAYTLTPEADRSYMKKNMPTIIIAGGIHGEERAGSFALYYMMKDLCEQNSQHPILNYLRHNVKFILLPTVNPYGFNKGQRYNYNGVNLNRNFDASWDSSLDASGDSAASEVETQAIQALIDENTDALALFDIHSNNGAVNNSDNKETNWLSLARTPVYDELETTALNQVRGLTMRMQELGYADGEDCAYATHTTPAGMMKNYALANGIMSFTCEVCVQLLSDDSSYGSTTQKINTEILENLVVNVLRCAAGTGGAVWEPES